MLLKKTDLDAIKAGRVNLVFRRWRKPTVKTGGSLKTAIGVLAIDRVSKVKRSQLTARDAVKAGYESLSTLLKALDSRDGDIYRIEIRFAGADPRIPLRENDALSRSELEEIQARLQRLDSVSRTGEWTRKVLGTVKRHPRVAAGELAERAGFEKEWLKTNIRKLKNLGLTISHQPGYELSPRGEVVFEHLENNF